MNSDTETSDIELNTEDVDDYNDDMCDIEKIMIKPEKTVIETVSDDKRTGRQLMTSKEFIRIVSERKVELIMGAKPLIKQNPKSEKLTYEEIAIEEIKNDRCPIKIRRFVEDHYEIWKVSELKKDHLLHIMK